MTTSKKEPPRIEEFETDEFGFDQIMLGTGVGDHVAYFSEDGNYGGIYKDGGELLILNVSTFTADDWEVIATAPDSLRLLEAKSIAEAKRVSGVLIEPYEKP